MVVNVIERSRQLVWNRLTWNPRVRFKGYDTEEGFSSKPAQEGLCGMRNAPCRLTERMDQIDTQAFDAAVRRVHPVITHTCMPGGYDSRGCDKSRIDLLYLLTSTLDLPNEGFNQTKSQDDAGISCPLSSTRSSQNK
jgi:hypothetical protein